MATHQDEQYGWLLIDMTRWMTIQGVLIVAQTTLMTSGSFDVFVYSGDPSLTLNDPRKTSAKCWISNDVGVNAKGGVFNCNRSGQYFVI